MGVSGTPLSPVDSYDLCIMALLSVCRFTTPDSPAELRDEGLCLYALERYSEAAESLEQYLQQSTWGPDHKQVWFVMPYDSQWQCRALLIFEARQSHVRAWCPWRCSCARSWRGCDAAKTLMHQRTRRRGRQDCSMYWLISPPLAFPLHLQHRLQHSSATGSGGIWMMHF